MKFHLFLRFFGLLLYLLGHIARMLPTRPEGLATQNCKFSFAKCFMCAPHRFEVGLSEFAGNGKGGGSHRNHPIYSWLNSFAKQISKLMCLLHGLDFRAKLSK